MKHRKHRKNRKIKFSEKDYFEKHYLRDGKAVIPITIDKVDDLYMKHDYRKMDLSDSLCNYIEEIAYIVPIEYDIILEIHSPIIDEEGRERIRKNFKVNYGMDIDDRDYEIKMSNIKALIMFFIGVFLMFFSYAIKPYIWDVLSEIIVIAGWVPLWDMIEIITLDTKDLKTERLNKLQLYDAKVTFVFDKENT